MNDVTRILAAIEAGERAASDELLPLVYEELRKLAGARLVHENPGQSLTATALVHEAYLRLVGGEADAGWQGRGHFFAAAAEAMRRILINRARDRNRLKRGGGWKQVDLSSVSIAMETPPDLLIDLDEAINALAEQDTSSAELIKLKFFAGLSLKEASASLGLTRRQGDRLWSYARAWLFDRLQGP
ncbi:MAG: ECF-type sigma factor [Planctomycetaceae bacterium]